MKHSTTLIYDGTFNGFLTAVFVAFEEKINVSDIQKNGQNQNGLFSDTKTIFTNVEKAKRVWNTIRNKSHNAITNIYFSFLSESEGIELILYTYIQRLMDSKASTHLNYSDGIVQRVNQLASAVGREKQRTEKLVDFQITKDDVRFAMVEPDANILPLISKHFRSIYSNQSWLIYDLKRGYGIYYNQNQVELISLNLQEVHLTKTFKSDAFLNDEYDYPTLLNDYIKNTKIKALINRKLFSESVSKGKRRSLTMTKEAV
ncbi:TIGR03915 family putative DNA repair protein [Flagellimonas sp. W118]|uniref:TIGR03915 family putative DNA repair protein n=1 Tax=Flagellimonas sp. W118 TaxID=3410791 RepID=UPI003BF4E987